MNQCKCGSFAINLHSHGRDGSDEGLCDVCYWRKRAEDAQKIIMKPPEAIKDCNGDNISVQELKTLLHKARIKEIEEKILFAEKDAGGEYIRICLKIGEKQNNLKVPLFLAKQLSDELIQVLK